MMIDQKLKVLFHEGFMRNKSPSYVRITIYQKESYFDKFIEDYFLGEKISKEIEEESIEILLGYYLLEEDVSKILSYLKEKYGDIEEIYTLSRKDLDKMEDKHTCLFYTIEDTLFLEFSSCCVVFIFGNND